MVHLHLGQDGGTVVGDEHLARALLDHLVHASWAEGSTDSIGNGCRSNKTTHHTPHTTHMHMLFMQSSSSSHNIQQTQITSKTQNHIKKNKKQHINRVKMKIKKQTPNTNKQTTE